MDPIEYVVILIFSNLDHLSLTSRRTNVFIMIFDRVVVEV